MNKEDIRASKISIFAHFSATGATEELRDWLIGLRIRELVYIAFPFGAGPGKDGKKIKVFIYRNGEPAGARKSLFGFSRPEIISYIKDFFYSLFYGLFFCSGSDILFCGDNLLSVSGNMLKTFGLVKKTVYYMIDYTPARYKNRFINGLYYFLDRTASYGSDAVWPLCERTIGGRFDDGRLAEDRVKWYAVPYGNHSAGTAGKLRHDMNSIVYMGGIEKNKGAELIIEIGKFLRDKNSGIRLTVIGGGTGVKEFREKLTAHGLENVIDYKGYIEKFDDVLDILIKCGIAIAPYYPFDKNSFTYYADPGKIKTYLGAGLPIVLTAVPPIYRTIEENGAGLISEYDAASFGKKIIEIRENYGSFEKNAMTLGRRYDWDEILSEAFGRLGGQVQRDGKGILNPAIK